MRRAWLIALALALLGAAALGEGRTAVDAFNALMAQDADSAEAVKPAESWLDEIMAGEYADTFWDLSREEALAEALEPLSAITDRDIAAYASGHGLKVAQVRNAYYKALANALRAHIAVYPATQAQYENIQLILELFLEPEPEGAASRAEVRARMTPEYSRRLAEQSALPQAFVEFLIMDEDWDDDSWDNDDDWRARTGWTGLPSEDFDAVVIGDRDTLESDHIAQMQELLISLGYLKGKADGVFGPRTQAALLEFQLANGLKPTGSFAASDLERMRSAQAVARWDYDDDFWDSADFDSYHTPDDRPDTPDGNTPDRNRPDGAGADTPDNNTPDGNTPDNNTPDDNTPDGNTPDRNTPDGNTPDGNTPDNNTPDDNTPDNNTPNTPDTPNGSKADTPDTPD